MNASSGITRNKGFKNEWFMENLPGRTSIPQLFGDDRLLVAEIHKGLHDLMGMRHIQADFLQLIINALETLNVNTK